MQDSVARDPERPTLLARPREGEANDFAHDRPGQRSIHAAQHHPSAAAAKHLARTSRRRCVYRCKYSAPQPAAPDEVRDDGQRRQQQQHNRRGCRRRWSSSSRSSLDGADLSNGHSQLPNLVDTIPPNLCMPSQSVEHRIVRMRRPTPPRCRPSAQPDQSVARLRRRSRPEARRHSRRPCRATLASFARIDHIITTSPPRPCVPHDQVKPPPEPLPPHDRLFEREPRITRRRTCFGWSGRSWVVLGARHPRGARREGHQAMNGRRNAQPAAPTRSSNQIKIPARGGPTGASTNISKHHTWT